MGEERFPSRPVRPSGLVKAQTQDPTASGQRPQGRQGVVEPCSPSLIPFPGKPWLPSDCRLPVLVKKNTPRLVWWGRPAPLAGPGPAKLLRQRNPSPVGCRRQVASVVSDSVRPCGPLDSKSAAWASGLRAPPRDCRGPPNPVGCFPATSLMGKASASVGPLRPGLGMPGRRAVVPGQGVASLPAAWVWICALHAREDRPRHPQAAGGPVTLGKEEAGTWSPRSPGRGRRGALSFQPQAPVCRGPSLGRRVGTPALK